MITDTEKQKIISMVGGIICQCGNPILLDRVNEVWFKILDKTIKSKLEAVEGEIAEIKTYGMCEETRIIEIALEIINKHK